MDGWMGGLVDGWVVDGWTDGRTGGSPDEYVGK